MADRRDLTGLVSVVTGADTEAGAASARALAAAGARALVLCGDDGGALGAVARDIEAHGCRSALFLGDITSDAGAADLVAMVHELFLAREQQATETARSASGPGR
ncbi:MAG TPA: KR domain-containing protein [Acidimicrobiia bacterium]|jgi:NAD(P)-dependent dehydrogenase (short-subunit alcohol dehydrogenase family)